jgi:hypothetical protein
MWYVEEFLIPSMTAQGILEEEILVWNDGHGWGNLKAFVESMRFVSECFPIDESIWHLQDDVLIASNFYEVTKRINVLAYGFCNERFDFENYGHCGETTASDSWHSFQCVCIPNHYAREFYEWFVYLTENTFRLMPWTKAGKMDDTNFRLFTGEKHPNDPCLNVRPNLVEHVDTLIGGSMLVDNATRNYLPTAMYFDEPELVEDLKRRLRDRGHGAEDE